MAYQEDKSVAPEHAAAEIGERISWGGRAIDGIGGVLGSVPRMLQSGIMSTTSADLGVLDVFGTLDKAKNLAGVGAEAAGGSEGLLSSLGISSFTPVFASIVAAGEGLKVLDDVTHGDMVGAGKHMVVGSAKAGVVFLDGVTMGIAEIPSLLLTGKFLSTNVGDVVGQMLDGADTKKPVVANLATVGYTDPAYAQAAPLPVNTQQQAAPYGMSAPDGGWAGYVQARRGMGQQQQQEVAQADASYSGNPRFADAVRIAQAAAAGNAPQQLNS